MDSQFFRKLMNSPRSRPVRHEMKSPSPKVVSIPVHFVRTARTRSAAALKIQKVFRGFLVRKSVRKILMIRNGVDEIERRFLQREMVDLLRREAKDRLKLNEMLMSLLFQLDSVRGIDSGVRDIRKAVIKKAISLQERMDAIVAGDQTLDTVDCEEKRDETLDASNNSETQAIKDPVDSAENCENRIGHILKMQAPFDSLDNCGTVNTDADHTLAVEDPIESVLNSGNHESILEASDEATCIRDRVIEVLEEPDVANEEAFSSEEAQVKPNVTLSPSKYVKEGSIEMEDSTEPFEKPSKNDESLVEEGEGEIVEKQEDAMEIQQPNQTQRIAENALASTAEGEENGPDGNRNLMEKMMEDNEKLMGLMTRLLERNELQTRLLSSLSHRVEQLERSFRSEKLRRKKKRQAAGVEKLVSKCGRKS